MESCAAARMQASRGEGGRAARRRGGAAGPTRAPAESGACRDGGGGGRGAAGRRGAPGMPRPGRAGRRRGDGARPGGSLCRRGRQQTGPPVAGRRTGRARRFKARLACCTAAEVHRNGGHPEPAGRLEDGGKGRGEAARIGFEAHDVREHWNRRSARLGPRRATRPCRGRCAGMSRGRGREGGARRPGRRAFAPYSRPGRGPSAISKLRRPERLVGRHNRRVQGQGPARRVRAGGNGEWRGAATGTGRPS